MKFDPLIEKRLRQFDNLCKERPPFVIITCITYNHKDYIHNALDGFVMQKTNFPFVAVIHDDASTDGTTDIIREYAEKNQNIIYPIFERENQYSKHDGSVRRIVNNVIKYSGAKYIAFCEGDDYWIDPLKLQKQVDFLESHPDFTICFHNAEVINETYEPLSFDSLQDREYTSNEVFDNWIVPTASILYRQDVPSLQLDKRRYNGDLPLILNSLKYGKGFGMSEKMSAYRVTNKGITIARRKEDPVMRAKAYKNHFLYIRDTFPKVDRKLVNKKIERWNNEYIAAVTNKNKSKGVALKIKRAFLHPEWAINRIREKIKN